MHAGATVCTTAAIAAATVAAADASSSRDAAITPVAAMHASSAADGEWRLCGVHGDARMVPHSRAYVGSLRQPVLWGVVAGYAD